MSEKIYDVSGIGSPLLDLTIEVSDSLLDELSLTKGQMHLVDDQRSKEILKKLENCKLETTPGGSSANTLAGVANLGGKGVLLGKIGNDDYARYYVNETERTGVKARCNSFDGSTGHAITLITPDSERTFATHLGAATQFRKEDVFEDDIIRSSILHIEGYLLELPEVREAVIHAMQVARENDVLISVDLADPGLIGRIYDVLMSIVRDYTNIVFVNEEEARAFTGKEEEDALKILSDMCDIAVVKLGEKGSIIGKDDKTYRIEAFRTDVVNTNGAGDMYAAGILYGLANNIAIERAGRIGSYASSLIVAQVGARLEGLISLDSID